MPFGCLFHCAAIGVIDLAVQQGGNQRDLCSRPD
jgi:hypothetical protein